MTRTQRLSMAAAVALGLSGAAMAEQSYDSVLKDAQNTQMMAVAPATFSGFTIGQGDNMLTIGLHMQVRYAMDIRKEAKNGNSDATDGFELRRVRLEASGSAISKDITYYVQWDSDRASGNVTLLDCWGQYRFADDMYIRAGQIKDPVFHEENVSDKYQLAVEKSVMNTLIGGNVTNRVQGAGIYYNDGKNNAQPFNAAILLHDGDNSKNTDFTNNGKYWGAAARAEYKAMGNWKDYGFFGAHNVTQDLLVIGVGGDVSEMEVATGGGMTQWLGTVDADYKSAAGFSVYGAFIVQFLDPRNGVSDSNVTNWGFLVQGAYELSQNWEVFARYDLTHAENEFANGVKNLQEIGAGVNYFLVPDAGHKAKVSLDVVWMPKGAPGGLSGNDIQGGNDKTEVVIRAQFNLAI